jgi:glutathione S-transferase
MLTLLGRRNSANVQKVLWCLDEMRLPYAQVDVGGRFGGNRAAAYLRLNPNGVVPTLIDDGFAVWESNTILRYLANRFGPTLWYPVEPCKRALTDRWMDWQLSALNCAMTPLYVSLVRTAPEDRDYSDIAVRRSQAEDLFSLLDVELARQAFLAGDQPTVADIACGVFAYRWFELRIQCAAEMPHLKRWYDELAKRASYRTNVMTGLT